MHGVTLKEIDDIIMGRLELLATAHGTSIEQEIVELLRRALSDEQFEQFRAESLKKMQQWVHENHTQWGGRTFSDSAEIIREEREGR